jgi:porphobilinogen deaminase
MLAKAGVSRLGIDLSEFHVEELTPTEFIPAPAQGALAIQIRESNPNCLKPCRHCTTPMLPKNWLLNVVC